MIRTKWEYIRMNSKNIILNKDKFFLLKVPNTDFKFWLSSNYTTISGANNKWVTVAFPPGNFQVTVFRTEGKNYKNKFDKKKLGFEEFSKMLEGAKNGNS